MSFAMPITRQQAKIKRAKQSARAFDPNARPIWEVIEQISSQVPAEEWAKVPTDGSINFRHCLYGHPKKGK
jgi:hypothetical protein